MTEWRKSSYSPNGTDCVEVGLGVGLRDSKAPTVCLRVGSRAWAGFLVAVKTRALSGR